MAFVCAPASLATLPMKSAQSLRYATNHRRRRSLPAPASGARHVRAGQEPPAGPSREDAELNLELQAKVRELFGGRENVSIEMDDADGRAEFLVRTAPDGADYKEYRSAVWTVGSVVAMSVVAGLVFTFLFFTGAVHGSSNERRYEMPTYGTRTYINPYQVLDEDRIFQDARQD